MVLFKIGIGRSQNIGIFRKSKPDISGGTRGFEINGRAAVRRDFYVRQDPAGLQEVLVALPVW
jgi:hypothetical protein